MQNYNTNQYRSLHLNQYNLYENQGSNFYKLCISVQKEFYKYINHMKC